MAAATTAGAVICGAGIAGVATAYFLAVQQGMSDVVLCDPRPPLTLTSDKSTECYRNWWPDPSMVSFMGRSIDLLETLSEESGNAFNLGRRGYLYVTGGATDQLVIAAARISDAGAGSVRVHRGRSDDPSYPTPQPEGWAGHLDGADVFAASEPLREQFPYLTNAARAATHVRRAGWFSAQQLGAWMLDRAREQGLALRRDRVVAVDVDKDRVTGVRFDNEARIATDVFINAAGPMAQRIAAMIAVDLPLYNEVHLKVAFRDSLGAIQRDAPMLIWTDPQRLNLSDEERALCIEQGRTDLLAEMPAGCHCRPEGGVDSQWVLGLWAYSRDVRQPVWPLPTDPLYADTVLRGLATMVPALAAYLEDPPQCVVDGGYYTRTTDNLPLIGPVGPRGSYVCGALSGFGIMAAPVVGELIAAYATGAGLPDYAAALHPDRYGDPAYREQVAEATATGQI
ncbi:MAG: FAD-dependent oxidoreductase [Acidimicrobiia bacterium]|nr:MAG: FAD-dependent oxidoreductase [Acidimicrobiia bacterium]